MRPPYSEVQSQARDRGLGETLLGHDNIGPSERTAEKLIATLTPLFDRAHTAGVLREGVTATVAALDVAAFTTAFSHTN